MVYHYLVSRVLTEVRIQDEIEVSIDEIIYVVHIVPFNSRQFISNISKSFRNYVTIENRLLSHTFGLF